MARPTFGAKEIHEYDSICSRCGQPFKSIFLQMSGRPIYCTNCIGQVKTLEMRLSELKDMLKKKPNDPRILKEIEKIKALIQRR